MNPGNASSPGTPGKIVRLIQFGIFSFLRIFGILKGVEIVPSTEEYNPQIDGQSSKK